MVVVHEAAVLGCWVSHMKYFQSVTCDLDASQGRMPERYRTDRFYLRTLLTLDEPTDLLYSFLCEDSSQ